MLKNLTYLLKKHMLKFEWQFVDELSIKNEWTMILYNRELKLNSFLYAGYQKRANVSLMITFVYKLPIYL